MTNSELIEAANHVIGDDRSSVLAISLARHILETVRVEVDLIGAGPFGLTSEDVANQDWLTIESRFLQRWRESGPGMSPIPDTRHSLSHAQRCQMTECLHLDRDWIVKAEEALQKVLDHGDTMPLMMGHTISLKKFLEPDCVTELLAGKYDDKTAVSQVDRWRRDE